MGTPSSQNVNGTFTGTFIAVPDSSDVTDYTADDVFVLGGANYPEETYRLNCSAHSADIDYAMSAV